MKILGVNINQKPQQTYSIFVGTNLLEKLHEILELDKYSQAAIITDTNVAKFHLQKVQQSLKIKNVAIVLPPGEKEKSIYTAEIIWKSLSEAKADRKSLVINLGGGVIGDIGGFAASTYMRGIDFVNIPTTILAQVDESVGGKTGFDFAGVKNLIGTFQQPSAVVIDVETVQSLPQREFSSGFAEIIKHGLIADKDYFQKVTAKKPNEFSQEELVAIIINSCKIKKFVVENDTTEKGLRKTLNFGHTIGHAIEALSLESNIPLLHGEAISIGIVAEAKLSQLKNHISDEDVETIKQSLHNAGLPITTHKLVLHAVLQKIENDKKNVSGKTKWTLLKAIGESAINEDVEQELVKQAIDFVSHD